MGTFILVVVLLILSPVLIVIGKGFLAVIIGTVFNKPRPYKPFRAELWPKSSSRNY